MSFTPSLKSASSKPKTLECGHGLCPGCGISVILKQAFSSIDHPVVVACATGCLEICTSCYPETAWNVPWIHCLFENTAATISGVETAYRLFKKKGKLKDDQKNIKFVAIGGDGGTYDIGLQALSGAIERGHDFIYICTDNEGYMNTGYQRSSASPFGASTTTSPAGKVLQGKLQFRKDLTQIIAAHHLPYSAQASPSNWADLMKKINKAIVTPGPSFINILSVCPTNWKTDPQKGMVITQSAIDTCFWPLYEVEKDKFTITYKPSVKKPITDWLANQGRFKHLFKPENKRLIDELQKEVDRRWEELLKREKLQ